MGAPYRTEAVGRRESVRDHLQAEAREPPADHVAPATRSGEPVVRDRAGAREGQEAPLAEHRRVSRPADVQPATVARAVVPAGGATQRRPADDSVSPALARPR